MDRKEINKRVGELIGQYAVHSIKLEISADNIHGGVTCMDIDVSETVF